MDGRLGRFITFGLVASMAVSIGMSAAHAAPGDSIALYMSAPLVQGSHVTGTGTITETFEEYTAPGDCPANIAQGTITTTDVVSPTNCRISLVSVYGGASSTAKTPSYGGAGSQYATNNNNAESFTISFAEPVKYVGFWWSAGSGTNKVEFFNDGVSIAEMASAKVMEILGATAPSPWPAGDGTRVVRAINGAEYPVGRYFGNPRGFTSATPVSPSSITPGEPFLYLHLYLKGGIEADQVRFSGGGFEFDNLTTSNLAQNPDDDLVFLTSVLGKSVQFKPNGADVTGAMAAQTDSSAANLTKNLFLRPGYRFIGWNTDEEGEGIAYDDQESYGFGEDLILYAQWAEITDEPEITDDSENPDESGLPETGSPFARGWLIAAVLLVVLSAWSFLWANRPRNRSNNP